MPQTDERYMQRCIELALQGIGKVAPNPMVGAVLVYGDRILAEGFHEQYGQAHAEVNCFNHVSKEDEGLLPAATLYISLEPCAHFGKTPPCADLIIRKQVKKVVIGCRDPFEQVNGKGIEKLENAGVEVVTGVMNDECLQLNKRFFTFHTHRRPYIILKWAQTANGMIAGRQPVQGSNEPATRLIISNEQTNRFVHKWRSEEAAILVGANTALADDPSLTNRLWSGNSPVRMVLDPSLRLPMGLKVYDRNQLTILLNYVKTEEQKGLVYYQLDRSQEVVEQILHACYQKKLLSLIVEGGARLLQSFISKGLWDEARIITNTTQVLEEGLKAPSLPKQKPAAEEMVLTDSITYYTNPQYESKQVNP